MSKKARAREILARNVSYLMKQDREGSTRVGQRAQLAQKTVNNATKADRGGISLQTIVNIANAYKLEPWQLLLENFEAAQGIKRLIDLYVMACPDGRDIIERIAEREAIRGPDRQARSKPILLITQRPGVKMRSSETDIISMLDGLNRGNPGRDQEVRAIFKKVLQEKDHGLSPATVTRMKAELDQSPRNV